MLYMIQGSLDFSFYCTVEYIYGEKNGMGPGESCKNCIYIHEFETKFERKPGIKAGPDEGVIKIKKLDNLDYSLKYMPYPAMIH